jgi:NTP pyrophosphatase (non-canonical NTP hydrolase)
MDDIQKNQLYESAWRHWGGELQINLLMEEMAEFIQAILKTRRNGVTYSFAFFEEMADVLIMLEQLEFQLKKIPDEKYGGSSWGQVMSIREAKLKRLENRLLDSMAQKCEGITDTFE